MPKEKIRDAAAMYDVHVGWERGKFVQVGVETTDGRTLAEHLSGDDGDGGTVTPASFKGVWGTLDRAGCERLIHVVRRAMVQAFDPDAGVQA